VQTLNELLRIPRIGHLMTGKEGKGEQQ